MQLQNVDQMRFVLQTMAHIRQTAVPLQQTAVHIYTTNCGPIMTNVVQLW